jgi:hypothetical protein
MTPIGSRLQLKLDNEYIRMANEWFFKWHHIGGAAIEIDSFREKPIRYGGIKFSGTAHAVYWDTIQHYLRQKVSQTFDDLEQEIKDYPPDVRRIAIKEAMHIVFGFVGKIRKQAVDKDRILRGDGITFPAARDPGRWEGSTNKEIQQRADALLAIYALETSVEAKSKLKVVHDRHQWWLYLSLTVIGVIAAILALL